MNGDSTDTGSGSGGGGGGRVRSSGADRARDEIIADLDTRLRRHEADTRATLAQLDQTVAESATLLSQALPRLDGLGHRVAELAGRLDTHSSNAGGGSGAGGDTVAPIPWPTLTATQAESEWNRLAHWIATVLGPWYQVTRNQVPDCWALHRPVLLELSWLHQAYLAAHTGQSASPVAAAEWHVRWLPAALNAIAGHAPPGSALTRTERSWDGETCHPGFHHDTRRYTERDRTEGQRPALPHEQGAGSDNTVAIVGDPIEYRFWARFWQHAVAEDLETRRQQQSQGPAPAG